MTVDQDRLNAMHEKIARLVYEGPDLPSDREIGLLAVIDELFRAVDERDEAIDQLHVQLAGVLVAVAGTNDPATPGDYGWSVAFEEARQLRCAYEALLRGHRFLRKLGRLRAAFVTDLQRLFPQAPI